MVKKKIVYAKMAEIWPGKPLADFILHQVSQLSFGNNTISHQDHRQTAG